MSIVYLKIKVASLAAEARYIRLQEGKLSKWKERLIISDVAFGDNFTKDKEATGWQVALLPAPQGHKDMTEEERKTYREQVWKYRARLRKANPAHNPDLRYSLYRHRVDKVRPEARWTQLALAYLRGRDYEKSEGKVRPRNVLSEIDLKKIWRMVVKFGGATDLDSGHKTLEAWVDGGVSPFYKPPRSTIPASATVAVVE